MNRERATGGGLRARLVAVDANTWIGPGEIRWDARGRITALRPVRGSVPDIAVLPGLVNAHAHLQLPPLLRTERAFMPWIDAVMASRLAATPAADRAHLRQSVRALLATGATAVGEIDSSGQGPGVLGSLPVRGRCYRELTGYHVDTPAAAALVHSRRYGAGRFPVGLSPHAPYSVSAALFRAAAGASRHLAIHCAELPAEQRFLRTGTGPFRALLARLGRLPADCLPPGVGAVRWLERLGLLRPTTQLVHCQELERGDAARIAAAGASIVVCPGTITWFRRTPPPVPRWLAAGIPVALGTDSRASNDELSMRRELRLAQRLWPELSPRQLFRMATEHGARALDLPVGRLQLGAPADLLVVEAGPHPAATLRRFLSGDSGLHEVRVGGRCVVGGRRSTDRRAAVEPCARTA